MVSAVKLARREEIQAVLVQVACKISGQLDENVDLVGNLNPIV
jgi:hypothetical protein